MQFYLEFFIRPLCVESRILKHATINRYVDGRCLDYKKNCNNIILGGLLWRTTTTNPQNQDPKLGGGLFQISSLCEQVGH